MFADRSLSSSSICKSSTVSWNNEYVVSSGCAWDSGASPYCAEFSGSGACLQKDTHANEFAATPPFEDPEGVEDSTPLGVALEALRLTAIVVNTIDGFVLRYVGRSTAGMSTRHRS